MIASIERAMERWTATLWAAVRREKEKPIEVVAGLLRACDENAVIVGRGRTVVPNHFTIELPRESYRELDGHAEVLAERLATRIRQYAAERHYTFAGPVRVRLRGYGGAGSGFRYRIRSHIDPTRPPARTDDLTRALPAVTV
ncbi:DUF3662 domain-containing protein [Streptomyces sp. NPDC054796]